MTYKGLTITRRGKRYQITATVGGRLYGTAGSLSGVAEVVAAFYYDESGKVLTALQLQAQ